MKRAAATFDARLQSENSLKLEKAEAIDEREKVDLYGYLYISF
jgi:hypothetical protein